MHLIAAALSAFEVVEHGKVRAYLRGDDAAWLRAAGVLEPETLAGSGGLGRGRGERIVLGGRQCFVKQYFRGGVLGKVLRDGYVSAARFGRELAAGEILRRRGLPVPAALALVIETRGLLCRAWLVSELIDGVTTLGAALGAAFPRTRRRLLRDAGAAIRRMHDSGVAHPDLTLDNIVVDRDGRVLVLDFDRCTLTPWAARRRHNLFRLHRSALKARLWGRGGTTAARAERLDIAAFLLGYERGGRVPWTAAAAFAAYRAWERAHAIFWKRA